MTKQTIDIILPAYHEQENIQKVITNIEKYVKTPHEITVVLQDRNDPTLKIITKFKKEFKKSQYYLYQKWDWHAKSTKRRL